MIYDNYVCSEFYQIHMLEIILFSLHRHKHIIYDNVVISKLSGNVKQQVILKLHTLTFKLFIDTCENI